MTPEPLSARNPRVARLARLVRRRDERDDAGLWVVEGPVLATAAVDAGLTVEDVYVDAGSLERPGVDAFLTRMAAPGAVAESGSRVWLLAPGVLDRMGDVATSQGVLALVRRPATDWPAALQVPFVVVLAEVSDPGNVGTLIRTAAAAGAGAVVAIGGADPAGPKVVRSSAGAVFSTAVVAASSSVAKTVDRLRAGGYRIAATVARGGEAYFQASLGGPLALLLGNEAHGLSPDIAASADVRLTIPLASGVESLNVAAAAAVMCFEVTRPGRLASGPDGAAVPQAGSAPSPSNVEA